MSPATIERLLKPTKQARYPAAKSATRPGGYVAFLDRGPSLLAKAAGAGHRFRASSPRHQVSETSKDSAGAATSSGSMAQSRIRASWKGVLSPC
jgi:hypothetical protein